MSFVFISIRWQEYLGINETYVSYQRPNSVAFDGGKCRRAGIGQMQHVQLPRILLRMVIVLTLFNIFWFILYVLRALLCCQMNYSSKSAFCVFLSFYLNNVSSCFPINIFEYFMMFFIIRNA